MKIINWILVKLGLREPKWKGQILIPETFTDEKMKKFEKIGWKFYNSYGIISTGDVKVERSEEHEQTRT